MSAKSLRYILSRIYNRVEARVFPLHHKERNEIAYWRSRLAAEGQLTNQRYVQSYTKTFDLEPSFYAGKRILDIGCGPRGSLEWADMAAERIGPGPASTRVSQDGSGSPQDDLRRSVVRRHSLSCRVF